MSKTVTRFAPYYLKSLRQNVRLKRAQELTGIYNNFSDAFRSEKSSPVIIFGSGASVLDFDFSKQIPRDSLTIAINDSVFLSPEFDLLSFELPRDRSKAESKGKKLNSHLFGGRTETLCRIPIDLRDLERYPNFILNRPSQSYLFTSVSALSAKTFNTQLRNYLSPKVNQNAPGIDPGYTLARVIIRLLKLGYSDIKLVGVDLFTPDYFWQSSEAFGFLEGLNGKPSQDIHSTADPKNKLLPAVMFLEKIAILEDEYSFRISSFYKSGSASILRPWVPQNIEIS